MQQLMTREIAKTAPRLYEQDGAEDPTVYAHYFSCMNGWDWWLLEFDGTDEAFGLVEGYDDELGYFSIKEMEELNRQMGFTAVERDSMGEAVRLALVAGEYVGGGLAVLLLDATDLRSEGYMAEWGVLTANVPAAAEWCRGHGNIAIDAAVPAALLKALVAAGILRMAGRSAASGMARYPLATVAGHALDGMGGLTETLEEALGSTVVVEYESGGDGGAFEAGTAPAGSAELERLIAAARSEADALAAAGGWAAVRVGFGDAETIDCETGRTVYVAG